MIFRDLNKAKKMAVQYHIIIVLKGHFTGVFYPGWNIFPLIPAVMRVWLKEAAEMPLQESSRPAGPVLRRHPQRLSVYICMDYAGDLAAVSYSEEAMLATDLINCIGKIFLEWKSATDKKN